MIEVGVLAVLLFSINMLFYARINNSMQEMDDVYASNAQITELGQVFDDVQDSMYQYLKVKNSQALMDYYQNEAKYRQELEKLNERNIDDSVKLLEKKIRKMSESYLSCTAGTVAAKRGRNVEKYKQEYDESLMHCDDDVHLWLVDIMLDKNSGFDLLTAIKSKRPDMPIVFMSARDQDFDRIIGLEKGCDEYITKPFNMKEVILRIHNVLKRVYKDTEMIDIDGYMVDESKRKVLENDHEIDLTTKEYELLLYFMKNKGIAISREQVLTRVWDENYFGSDRVVDDTLRRLRKKMPNINIKTIYGFGYRLD